MTDSDVKRMISAEVAKQLNIILNGVSKDSSTQLESIASPYPGMATIESRPLVQPFGFHGRAPDGTLNVSARIGSHPGSRYVLGHRDSKRPSIESGESVIYSIGGYQVRIFNGRASIGKVQEDGSVIFETMLVGESTVAFLIALLDLIETHTHAAAGTPPSNAASFVTLSNQNLENGKILAKDGGRF